MTAPLARLAALLGAPIASVTPLAGGDLSTVLRIHIEHGDTLIAKLGPQVAVEATMLGAIAATGAPAPCVVAVADDMLVMTECESDGHLAGAWSALADALARLHAPCAQNYGWDVDYAFGPVAIVNARRGDWPGFWADHRLRCHLPHLPRALGRRVESLADSIGTLLPARPPPALLHGDLWSGNILAAGGAITGLIDPACVIGDREADIAMLTLFDSPPSRFFDSLMLEPGWRARLAIYRLWPLLVHLRLFGSSYTARVTATLDEIGF
ncbi:fructosamine-3-kinase [Hephaestia caeni]|uniref:Fructosamine-3-kinase n=1 Tax=Hephaestia caeni TaxID=645617 RepID=A0A397PC04_9SPHN|nr:fructosamine kinase family protein [Hephaestia caeni]RIA47090.1 fructosamine-3-kinase [Hephaestia caeni]